VLIPMNPTIEEEFQPSMEIMLNLPSGNENMPQKILLLLNWIRGTFWKSTDNESWDITGWAWQVAVDFKTTAITADDLVTVFMALRLAFTRIKAQTHQGSSVLSLSLDFTMSSDWASSTSFNPKHRSQH
jgi:hypothetical protein